MVKKPVIEGKSADFDTGVKLQDTDQIPQFAMEILPCRSRRVIVCKAGLDSQAQTL